jgi:hypothetical protein
MPTRGKCPPYSSSSSSPLLSSVVAMRTVSHGSRNAFWSDIYEMTMCFALSWAVLKTLLLPRKAQPFAVTPKGQRVTKNVRSELALV